jgi:fatty-acyl-CoA synthase
MSANDLSHVTGAREPPLIEKTIGAALAEAAEKWGDHSAIISVRQSIHWTYRELLERADGLAAGLRSRATSASSTRFP